MGGGLLIELMRLDAARMMFRAAVINGALAPPLILLVILLSSDRRVMGDRVSSPVVRALAWIAFAVLSHATVAMLTAT